jgi:hypothetical protein
MEKTFNLPWQETRTLRLFFVFHYCFARLADAVAASKATVKTAQQNKRRAASRTDRLRMERFLLLR